MSTLVKAGPASKAAAATKKTRDVTPKLICIITGTERFTNKDYLEAKATAAGSRKRFLEHYVCSDAMKHLREKGGEKGVNLTGATVDEIRTLLKVKPEDVKDLAKPSIDTLKTALEINGKRAKKPAKKKETTTKPAGEKKPATPRAPRKPAAPKTPAATTEAPAATAAPEPTPSTPAP